MHKASAITACGADFLIVGATYTMLKSAKPVVAVCAVRTGCGKSPTTRHLCRLLRDAGHRVVAVRHPMPYGDLAQQAVQRFADYEDLDRRQCTIEEREEYEPYIDEGIVVYAGVDYERVLQAAEAEADVLLWDGGNNDTPFFRPDVHVVVLDPHRAGHERLYHPGETNLRMADIAVINKVDSATDAQVACVRRNVEAYAPRAAIVLAASELVVDTPERIRGVRVLVVEDGPTVTHGEMAFGAGLLAAKRYGAAQVIDPAPYLTGSLRKTFDTYPHLKRVLPAMGYGASQVRDLEATIARADCDLVLCATPIDLTRVLTLNKPSLRVRYLYRDHGPPALFDLVRQQLGPLLQRP